MGEKKTKKFFLLFFVEIHLYFMIAVTKKKKKKYSICRRCMHLQNLFYLFIYIYIIIDLRVKKWLSHQLLDRYRVHRHSYLKKSYFLLLSKIVVITLRMCIQSKPLSVVRILVQPVQRNVAHRVDPNGHFLKPRVATADSHTHLRHDLRSAAAIHKADKTQTWVRHLVLVVQLHQLIFHLHSLHVIW